MLIVWTGCPDVTLLHHRPGYHRIIANMVKVHMLHVFFKVQPIVDKFLLIVLIQAVLILCHAEHCTEEAGKTKTVTMLCRTPV